MQLLPILYTVKLFVVHYLQISPAVSSVDIHIIARNCVFSYTGYCICREKVNGNIVIMGFTPEITGCNVETGWFVFLCKISQPRVLEVDFWRFGYLFLFIEFGGHSLSSENP